MIHAFGSHRKSRREYAADNRYAKVQQVNGGAKARKGKKSISLLVPHSLV